MKYFYYKLLYKRKTVLLLDAIIRTLILKGGFKIWKQKLIE